MTRPGACGSKPPGLRVSKAEARGVSLDRRPNSNSHRLWGGRVRPPKAAPPGAIASRLAACPTLTQTREARRHGWFSAPKNWLVFSPFIRLKWLVGTHWDSANWMERLAGV